MKTHRPCMSFLCAACSFYAMAQNPSSWQDEENRDISWWGNKSTKTYTISTAQQLAGVAYLVNNEITTFRDTTISLVIEEDNTIDLSAHYWVPIGNSDHDNTRKTFQGSFFGNNNTITGLRVGTADEVYEYTGFFGYILCNRKAIIKDITLDGGAVMGNYDVGILAGKITTAYVNAPADLIIHNCHSKSFTINNGSTVGGLIGSVSTSSAEEGVANILIRDCSNSTEIETSFNGGGICGDASTETDGVQTITISHSHNTGTIAGNYAGGIIGRGSSSDSIIICNNYNAGTIIGKTITVGESTQGRIGGIAGHIFGNEPGEITVRDCYNTGEVKTDPKLTFNYPVFAGGITGYVSSKSKITNCYNTGAIYNNPEVTGIAADRSSTGNIIGLGNCLNPKDISITNCLGLSSSLVGKNNCHRIVGHINKIYEYSSVNLENNYAGVPGSWIDPKPDASNENGADWTSPSSEWTDPITSWDFTDIWVGTASPRALPILQPYNGESPNIEFDVVVSLDVDPAAEKCITLLPKAGKYKIEQDSIFTLQVNIGNDCDGSQLEVTANGEVIIPEKNKDELPATTYTYKILIGTETDIKVTGVNPISVEDIQPGQAKVYTIPNHIVIERYAVSGTQNAERNTQNGIRIYTINGQLVANEPYHVPPTTYRYKVPAGLYLVAIGEKIFKVMVND